MIVTAAEGIDRVFEHGGLWQAAILLAGFALLFPALKRARIY